MRTRTTAGAAALVAGGILCLGVPAAAQAPTGAVARSDAADFPPVYHIALSGQAGALVKVTIEGAVRRLARPRCQELFTDFTTSEGQPLSATLTAREQTPGEALAALYFVEGDSSRHCHEDDTTGAFTAPGHRVIFVCGERFATRFGGRVAGEILLIHELLHALGLGENPPTSAEITRRVRSRCGDWKGAFP